MSKNHLNSKKHCWDCAYRKNVPGNAHIECMRDFKKIEAPERDAHGVRNGWCFFPTLFDPVWLGKCKGFAKKLNPKNVRKASSAMESIFAILGSVGRI